MGTIALGLGDAKLLFFSLSRKGVVTFADAIQICRVLRDRRRRVNREIAIEDAEIERIEQLSAQRADALAVLYGGGSVGVGNNSASSNTGHPPPPHPHVRLHHSYDASTSAASTNSASHQPGRPVVPPGSSASVIRKSTSSSSASSSPYHSGGGDPHGMTHRGMNNSKSVNPHSPTASHLIFVNRDPPILMRESIPPPPCPFPKIAARIASVHTMYRDGEVSRVLFALRDLQRDWEEEAAQAALKAFLRSQRGGGGGGGGGRGKGGEKGGQSLTNPPSAAATANATIPGSGHANSVPSAPTSTSTTSTAPTPTPPTTIPSEGRLWLLLMHGCCMALEGRGSDALRSIQAAENLFNPNELGLDHPYHYLIHLCFGILLYYDGKLDRAIEKFEVARELAGLLARGKYDPTARRNMAACLNNKGVCYSLGGRRAEAVIAFRAARQLVRATENVPASPEAAIALRNLGKAVRQGFALNTARFGQPSRPRTAYDTCM
eukprot:CAMPEP_0175047728 /NCGR_PEP_ID=MMETSP0052_2-20121109/5767_1 /TAXON_ID=51329 ORGANISM="Polytomella parva, Strain SAG 63-3" /NCGR_SAMPLE_ID=MMETSP0052_2 /ASSEMBLY_ACC=CAM_ASM_000194 /LENGTH=491 /DNA_ID=CAMNT_0016311657 /DNA_START=177 /DNA_END=1649 /DNA_ORIENTATION=-